MKNKIIDTFKSVALVYEDKKGGPKLDALQTKLNEKNIPNEWISGVGLIVNKQENPTKVIVSHMDLIPKFRKGFTKNNICKIDQETITGALDNTITNAVMLHVIEKLFEEGKYNGIEFLFSEGEEVDFHGIDNYLKTNKNRVQNALFINLDVTNEGYKQHASVEYDSCNFEVLKGIQAIEAEKDFDFFYTADREGDDTDAILSNNCHGFSYCLPTKGLIHSYKNKARLDSIEPYYNGLLELVLSLNVNNIELKENVSSWNFDQALKVSNISDIKVASSTHYNTPSLFGEESEYEYSYSDYMGIDKENNEENIATRIQTILDKNKFPYSEDLLQLIEYSVKLDFFEPLFFYRVIGEERSEELFKLLGSQSVLLYMHGDNVYVLDDMDEGHNYELVLSLVNLDYIQENITIDNIISFLRQLMLIVVYRSNMSYQFYAFDEFNKAWIDDAVEYGILEITDDKKVVVIE